MQAKLSERLIADLAPSTKEYEVVDSIVKGFSLVVRPSGVMSFVYRYRNESGIKRTYTIGKYGTITAKAARELAELKAAQVKTGVDIQSDKKQKKIAAQNLRQQTFKIFLEERYAPYLTVQRKSGGMMIRHLQTSFLEQWGNRPLSEINSWLVTSWRNQELKRNLKPTSVNRSVSYLKALLARAVEWGVIETNPLKIKPLAEDKRGNVRFLDAEEEARLISALEERQNEQRAERRRYNNWCLERKRQPLALLNGRFTDYLMPMILVALHTGLRRGELFSLRWSQINFERKILTLLGNDTKSGHTRHIPLNTVALSILNDWKESSSNDKKGLVFPSPVSEQKLDNIKTAWGNLIKRAKIIGFRFHDLRHTFASNLVMRGVDLYTVKELLGHSTIEMTQRYAHLSADHKAAAVALLG